MADRNAVVLVADANYFPAGAFIAEQLAALCPPADTDIVLASDSQVDMDKARRFGLRAELMPFEPGLLSDRLPVRVHFTAASYYRLFLPRLLAKRYSRILYIDTDIYIHGRSLFDLFRLDMQGHAIGAVRDPVVAFREVHIDELVETLGRTSNKYMNSGVMLIDVARYLADDLETRVLAVATASPSLRLVDQTAINMVLRGNWLELSPSYNCAPLHWASFVRRVCVPVITHVTGPVKHWHGPHFNLDHPARRDFERFLKETPWADFLSRFYDFQDAWKAVANRTPTFRLPPNPLAQMTIIDARRVAAYLRTTAFADVEQGINQIALERIPDGL